MNYLLCFSKFFKEKNMAIYNIYINSTKNFPVALLTFKITTETPTVTTTSVRTSQCINGPGSTCCLHNRKSNKIDLKYPLVEICIKMGKHERHKKRTLTPLKQKRRRYIYNIPTELNYVIGISNKIVASNYILYGYLYWVYDSNLKPVCNKLKRSHNEINFICNYMYKSIS